MRPTTSCAAPAHRHLFALGAAALLSACSADAPTAPAASPSLSLAASAIWSDSVEGSVGPGSTFKILRPAQWNGDAVFYAHGFRDVATPVDLRESQDNFGALRDSLGARGFAVAYTSWSENGVAVKNGAQSVHQLRGLFASTYGSPARAYLAGHSLGGLVVQQLVEKYPDQYDGALAMCGVMGGIRAEVQYLGHTRAVWDALFPGVLPGNVAAMPEITDVSAQIVNPVVAAIMTQPGGIQRAFAIARIAQTPVPFVPTDQATQVQTLIGSLAYALAFHARGLDDLTDRTHGRSPFDNSETIYTGALDPATLAFLNATVVRVSSSPDAQNYLDRHYEPTGDVRMPLVSLHTMWDAAVPIFHQQLLAQKVGAAGQGAQLLQRAYPAYGHCNFTVGQVVSGFDSLVQWVTTGTKPAA